MTPARVLGLAGLAAVLVGLGETFGYLRAVVAMLMAAGILYLGLRRLYRLANAPPDPEPTEVSDHGVKYVCSVCGLELRLEVAAHERAPTHCREKMVLVRDGGPAPLRPL